MSKECLMCGNKLSKVNYYPVFDIRNNKTLEFCCRECYERYLEIERELKNTRG